MKDILFSLDQTFGQVLHLCPGLCHLDFCFSATYRAAVDMGSFVS